MAREERYNRPLTIVSIMPAIQLFLGFWLLASPYVLQFTWYTEARKNVGLIAPLVIMFALTRLAVTPRWYWVGWINGLIGIWLAVLPFAFGLTHDTSLTISFVAVGVLLIITSIISSFERTEKISDDE